MAAPRSPELPRQSAAPRGTALYVHLPFCAAKCHYCDFFSVAAEGQDRAAMIEAILEEARRFAPPAPRTVFLGGGTPSLLSCAELERLLEGLEQTCGWRASALEVTAECNPESLDEEKARCLLGLGVRRLSIGFQSLHDDVLELFGRVHDTRQSFEAYAAARRAGVEDVNIDLIYAIPGQQLETWEADLERVLALGPQHVSAYNLTFEEETLFRRWMEEGRLKPQPEERELEFFWRTREILGARGFEAYEISNFAQPGRACRHNLNYWFNGEYQGLGPSAVSKVGTRRAGNVKGIQGYVRRIREQADALAWSEDPADGDRLGETWWLGLRLAQGLSAAEARSRARYPPDAADRMGEITARMASQGLLCEREGRWSLTPAGLPLADYVARQFLAASG